jgi:hypothetical protein
MIEIGVANVVTPKGPKDYVTLASPSMAFSAGLIPEAILGVLKQPLAASGTLTPENFMTNSVFRQFLAGVIAKHGPDNTDLQAEAKRIGKGYVVVVDLRTRTPQGAPPEDIIGAFTVEDGKVVAGSYQASPNHKLLTAGGFFRLDSFLEECLKRELAALASDPGKPADPA